MEENNYKRCKLCGAYLNLVPIWKRVPTGQTRGGYPIYKNVIIGEREAYYKSSEEDPDMDDDCLLESKLRNIKRITNEE